MTEIRPSRYTPSVRRLLVSAMGVVALCVVALGVAMNAVFVPRIEALHGNAERLMGQMQDFAEHGDRLRAAVTSARRWVAANELDSAQATIRRPRAVTSTSLSGAARTAMIGAPLEMRTALAEAIDHESQVRDLLSEAGALLELGRKAGAEQTLERADSMTSALTLALAGAQQAGLQDVARRGRALERIGREVSGALLLLSILAILGVGVIGLLMHRRLYVPLRRIDRGLRAVSEGNLDTSLEVTHDDEMGRLGTLFNRMVREIRQREAEHEDERREMTRRILDATLDAVITVTPEGRITGWNPGAEVIFGWTAQEVRGRFLGDLIFPPSGRYEHQERLRLVRDGKADALVKRRIEVTAVRRDGRQFTAEMSIIPILEGGKVVAVSGFIRDVTETVELQEQVRRSQRLEAIGRLAGGIAHDFNNLVSVVVGQAQLAMEVVEDDDARRSLVEIERAGRRAAELTSQLLAFARKQIVTPRDVDVNELVADTLRMVDRVIESSVSIDPDLDGAAGRVHVDPGHFSQVLLNLLMNARDALGPRGGNVRITTEATSLGKGGPLQVPAGEYVRIVVVDNGPGIHPDSRDRIFEPFFTTKSGGTGLGLATCHGIVRQAGGAITARNLDEGGAEFAVYLPRINSPSVSIASTS